MGVLTPFLAGILIAYILYLPCRKIEGILKENKKKKLFNKHARGISILITYIIAIIIIITIILNVIIPIVIQSMTDLLTNLPNYYNSITSKISELPEDNILRSEKAVEVMNNIKDIDLNQYINMEKNTKLYKKHNKCSRNYI